MGNYVEALPLLNRALQIDQTDHELKHYSTAVSLNNLATLQMDLTNYAAALPLLLQAHDILEHLAGPENPAVADTLANLGELYLRTGDYPKALAYFQQELVIRTKAPGSRAGSFSSMVSCLTGLERWDEARSNAVRACQASEQAWQNILGFASEQQRLAYQAARKNFDTPCTLGWKDPMLVAQTILRFKGLVIDSLVEDRQVARTALGTDGEEILDEFMAARRRLVKRELQQNLGSEESERELQSAREEVRQLETQLARRISATGRSRRALSVTVEQVQTALPAGACLVDYIRYKHYRGSNCWEVSYGAVVLGGQGQPQWVSLVAGKELESAVQDYQRLLRSDRTPGLTELTSALKRVCEKAWSPVERILPPGVTNVIISPDGDLNFVSFAALWRETGAETNFLGEKFAIRYVSSGRDLLASSKAPPMKRELAIWADPAYDQFSSMNKPPDLLAGGSISASLRRSRGAGELVNLRFDPLDFALPEAKALAGLATKNLGFARVRTHFGAAATEIELKRVRHPYVLHLATHGVFLPESAAANPADKRLALGNPMHRSLLAFVGANQTLEAWRKEGVPPDPENDGLLMAEEVGTLDLNGTWLVVLSACDTGLGTARTGEGVLGLRRGFVMAGAQNLLMTLWRVDDKFTADFMVEFYEKASKSGDAPGALAQLQRKHLESLRKSGSVWQAVKLAGPFVMSSQGR